MHTTLADAPKMLYAAHTYESREAAGTDYDGITWATITERLQEPTAYEKERSPFVVLSTYRAPDARRHKPQLEHGRFVGLAVDIDCGDHPFDKIEEATRAVFGDAQALIYSTSSATAEKPKWRVLVPLAKPMPGSDYGLTQEAVFALYKAKGITCCESLAGTGQPVYLPNVPPSRRGPDGAPLFYRGEVLGGEPFELGKDHAINKKRLAIHKQTFEAGERARQEAAKRAAKRFERDARGDDGDKPIDYYNERHSVDGLLIAYGFKPTGRKDTAAFYKVPKSTSGSRRGMVAYDGKLWVSLSSTFNGTGCGEALPGRAGQRFGDAYDLFVHFEHGGDHAAAWRAIRLTMPKTEWTVTFGSKKQPAAGDEADFDSADVGGGTEAAGPVTPKPAPFPAGVLPEQAHDMAATVSECTGFSRDTLEATYVSLVSGLVGATRPVTVADGHRVPPMLWLGVVAPSGSAKSPAMGLMMAPIVKYDTTVLREQRVEQRRAHDEEWRRYEIANKVAESEIRKGVANVVFPTKPDRPKNRPPETRILAGDATIEAHAALCESNPAGLITYHDELRSFFAAMQQPGGVGDKARGYWLRTYDNASETDHRMGREGIEARVAATILGGLQPAVVREVFGPTSVADGTVSRFMLVWRGQRDAAGTGAADGEILRRYESHILNVIAHCDDLGDRPLRLSEESFGLYQRFRESSYQRLKALGDEPPAALAGFLGKLPGTLARVAGTLQVAHGAAGNLEFGQPADVIGLEVMQKALLLTEWIEQEFVRTHDHFWGGGGNQTSVAPKLLAWLRKQSEWVKVSRISCSGPRAVRGCAELAEAAVLELLKAGLVETDQQATESGPPAWVVRAVNAQTAVVV